mmetsp:Transcript_38399/g.62232  ORF Transcript_38399/g.62232 Transcript_38399/m.62232 type:complete len:320 (-) Transcript_38399:221-1180(-)|eukprot:CAMPEP_0184661268 /NCGR_PEP_ID=MMETSP0308-20130426/37735_1 /TAXON_ID=38269 /ORGANISM="Gloeochaete witrockiana, Strain SAG 46.84" /LENGTH=319 /DNA_ID=CAMNT_0027102455 /DNA_START=37 /DNA_END=996 /DNA_ORIENTATION=-
MQHATRGLEQKRKAKPDDDLTSLPIFTGTVGIYACKPEVKRHRISACPAPPTSAPATSCYDYSSCQRFPLPPRARRRAQGQKCTSKSDPQTCISRKVKHLSVNDMLHKYKYINLQDPTPPSAAESNGNPQSEPAMGIVETAFLQQLPLALRKSAGAPLPCELPDGSFDASLCRVHLPVPHAFTLQYLRWQRALPTQPTSFSSSSCPGAPLTSFPPLPSSFPTSQDDEFEADMQEVGGLLCLGGERGDIMDNHVNTDHLLPSTMPKHNTLSAPSQSRFCVISPVMAGMDDGLWTERPPSIMRTYTPTSIEAANRLISMCR